MKKDTFNNLMSWLSPDYDYTVIHSKLVYYFKHHNCNPAEELADNTLDIVSEKIDKNGDIKFEKGKRSGEIVQKKIQYIYGIAKNKCYEYWRKKKQIEHPQIFIDPPGELPNDLEKELQKECLDELRINNPKKCELIVEYHYDDKVKVRKRHEKLAKRLNITMNALAWRIKRIKDNLQKCVEKKMT